MLSALIIATFVSSPAPAPLPLVLDGCNTASAIRAAHIREMAPGKSDTLAAVADLLLEEDGAICLMESDVLVDLFRAQKNTDIIARTLVVGLASDRPHVAARAGQLITRIGLVDAKGFARLLTRDEMNRAAWNVVRAAIHDLAPGAKKNVLGLVADRHAPLARAL
ncbi:MAG: hypothetical protein IT385_14600 [Deltaproteobacteria bacterium]|nr:hypothetical protein [Deltaproteobacteria bacterium]